MKFYQNWSARVCGENPSDYFAATVPGNVQLDYARYLGIADNIQFGCTAKELKKTEGFTWEYRTVLDYDAKTDEKIFFVAGGIDYIFDILLDGENIYSYEGMFSKVEADITDRVKKGSVLQVIIHPHPKMKGVAKDTREEAAQSCKPCVHYEWDWNPRLLISGFWLPAYIETRASAYIYECEPFYKLDLDRLCADVHFEIKSAQAPVITVTDPDGKTVYSGSETDFRLEDIKLWWCNGQGEPLLYKWTAKTCCDEKSGTIGFKTVKLVLNTGTEYEPLGYPKSQYPSPATVELNGRRIFAKGSNFVNAEIFNANTTAEENEKLVLMAKNANMNIFRVWGGAGLAKPEFYDYCDRYGIMVWQEFPLACNNYVGTDKYLAVLEREATSIIKQLRSHACLTIWCGGNELFNGWSKMDDQSYAIRLMDKLCYELDRERPFMMTSPRAGMGHGGYLFEDPEGIDVYRQIQSAYMTAYSEFGVPSLAPVEQLKKIIPEEKLFPIMPEDEWCYHHAFKAWGDERWACLDVIGKYFGKLNDLKSTVDASQWLQSEGYKAVFEESRRQWPHCSMAINWCYNEPWITAANNSIISYPDVAKPAYHAVKNSLRPVMASARIPKFSWQNGETLSFEIWYHNDSPTAVKDKVSAVLEIGGKKYDLLQWDVGEVAANSNKLGPAVNYVLPVCPGEEEFKVYLITESGNTVSDYRLKYKCTVAAGGLRQLNT